MVFVVVFLIAHWFFIQTWWSKPNLVKNASSVYIALSLPSLLFVVAAICLPQLLKLKLPGVELEKASVAEVSAPSIEISRPMTSRFGDSKLEKVSVAEVSARSIEISRPMGAGRARWG